MSERKCGCVYADERNTPAVRTGHEMGGYLKKPCAEHADNQDWSAAASPEESARQSGASLMRACLSCETGLVSFPLYLAGERQALRVRAGDVAACADCGQRWAAVPPDTESAGRAFLPLRHAREDYGIALLPVGVRPAPPTGNTCQHGNPATECRIGVCCNVAANEIASLRARLEAAEREREEARSGTAIPTFGCNRCQYVWPGAVTCPSCGHPPTHDGPPIHVGTLMTDRDAALARAEAAEARIATARREGWQAGAEAMRERSRIYIIQKLDQASGRWVPHQPVLLKISAYPTEREAMGVRNSCEYLRPGVRFRVACYVELPLPDDGGEG